MYSTLLLKKIAKTESDGPYQPWDKSEKFLEKKILSLNSVTCNIRNSSCCMGYLLSQASDRQTSKTPPTVFVHLLPSLGCGRSEGKKSACNVGAWGRSPGEGNDSPLQYSCLQNPLGQRSLVGYIAESDLTESHTHTHTRVNTHCF